MSVTVPVFTEVAVVSAQVLPRGSTVRGTIDLTARPGGFLFLRIGRGGITALSAGVTVQVRRVYGGSAGTTIHPAGGGGRVGSTLAAVATTVNVDSAAGGVTLNVATAGAAAGDLICIQDSGGGVTRLEWARIAKVATGVYTLDAPLQFAHTAVQADTVRNLADVFSPIWLAGGALHEVLFDYGPQTTGESVTVAALCQRQDNDTTT